MWALSFAPGRAVLEGAKDLMERIKSEFAYEIGATTASTTPPMSFALRRGVCQDFSHIMISGMRSLGLPAAYVSGYLRTVQSRSGKSMLAGADAMHAWVLAWCGPTAGWIGLENPTASLLATIMLCSRSVVTTPTWLPMDGMVFASGGQRLAVSP